MGVEEPLFFAHSGDQLLGMLHHPQQQQKQIGVLIVVGGPQYRVGSHRQFTLLARDLTSAGIPVFRFDYRGMGDSSGTPRDFEAISGDIRAAIDKFYDKVPHLRGVVLWGLCDAATANAFYAPTDNRVVGQIALNPWARTIEGEAKAYIKHYYLNRVLNPEFWHKVFRLKFDAAAAFKDLIRKLGQSRRGASVASKTDTHSLPHRLREAQIGFDGPTLLILSGQDLTAREYESCVTATSAWQEWMLSAKVEVRRLEQADHTFSRAIWRDQVAAWSAQWTTALAD